MEVDKFQNWVRHHPIEAVYCWAFIVLIFVDHFNITGIIQKIIWLLLGITWIGAEALTQLAIKKRAIDIPNNPYRNQVDFRISLYLNAACLAFVAFLSFL